MEKINLKIIMLFLFTFLLVGTVSAQYDTTDTNTGTGTEGTTGEEGTTGTEGTTGEEGTTGTEGTTGEEGTTGTESWPGTEGTTGTESTPGTEGEAGTQEMPGTEGTQDTWGQDTSSSMSGFTYNEKVDEVTEYLTNSLNLRSQQISQIRSILINYSENQSGDSRIGTTDTGSDTSMTDPSGTGTQDEMLGGVTRDNIADRITEVLDEEQKSQFEEMEEDFLQRVDEIQADSGTEEKLDKDINNDDEIR